MKKKAASLAVFVLFLCSGGTTTSQNTVKGHSENSGMGRNCDGCHRGHGAPKTMMLPAGPVETCLSCHGVAYTKAKTKSGGKGAARQMTLQAGKSSAHQMTLQIGNATPRQLNLRENFSKPYRHPIETASNHRRDEVLPERDPSTPRHASCLDCHDAHQTRSRFQYQTTSRGIRRRRSSLREEVYEYHLCYRCHSDSANIPYWSRNIRDEITSVNRSYHPVEAAGMSDDVPSLRNPYTTSSIISCTDCHGGDTPRTASSVHGSTHAGLLQANYSTRDGQIESDLAYRLCYRCHERSSILANKSFSLHRDHIVDPDKQTSCHTCHASHGSPLNDRLIEFNQAIVSPNMKGILRYRRGGHRSGECYLSCHGAEHDPGRYCMVGSRCEKGNVRKVESKSDAQFQQEQFIKKKPSPFDTFRPVVPR